MGQVSSVRRSAAGSFLEHGMPVVNIDKLTYAANLRSLDALAGEPAYAFEQVDICDQADVEGVFAKYQPDATIHLAAESHVDRSITGPSAFINTSNVVGTYAICWKRRETITSGCPPDGATGFASSMSRPMKSMAHLARPACFVKRPPIGRARLIRPARRLPTISRMPGSRHMACRSLCRIARTITVLTNFLRN